MFESAEETLRRRRAAAREGGDAASKEEAVSDRQTDGTPGIHGEAEPFLSNSRQRRSFFIKALALKS